MTEKQLNFVFYIDRVDSQSGSRVFAAFEDSPSKFLTGLVEETDTDATTLAGARILLTELHSQLTAPMLQGNTSVTIDALESTRRSALANDWIALWKHEPYYELQEFLSVADVYNNNEETSFTFFVRVSPIGFENLTKMRCNKVRKASSEELSDLFRAVSQADSDFKTLDQILDAIRAFNEQKADRKHTFIQFINKPQNWDKFVPGRSFVPVHAIYKGVFKRKFEKWIAFNVAKDEYPNEDLLDNTRAIIVPGSGAGAWETTPWVVKLSVFLKKTHDNFPQLKFVGICFGFQIIAQTFGGKVKQMEERKKDPHFHVIGNEQLQVTKEFTELPFVKDVFPSNTEIVFINKGHGDFVEELPSNVFSNIGSSVTANNELAISRDHRMLCLQGHPEYSFEYSRRLMATFSTCHDHSDHDWNWHMKTQAFLELFSKPNDHSKLLQVINNFLRY